ncbi:MAG: hypothetical protein B1H04_01730 [Planctomycetales bacterium 4484_123]|nr:MAG: hypothetical protein B1H04_01730 [Planctomycetales bacterium 4484_123]
MDAVVDALATYWTRWVWPICQFLIGLGLVIFFHELGHFLAAKWAGVKVLRFSIGFGPRVWSFRRGETLYRMGLLPLGGYVHMLGQDDFNPVAAGEASPGDWRLAPPRKRLVILAAGVAMNVVLAVVAFVVVYLIGIRFQAPVVGSVREGFPAATVVLPEKVAQAMGVDKAVGLRPGDRILAIDGKRIFRFRELSFTSGLSGRDETFRLTVRRTVNGREIDFDVLLKPKLLKPDKGEGIPEQYVFGISPAFVINEPTEHHYAGRERFQPGDIVGEVNGRPTGLSSDLLSAVDLASGQVEVTAIRAGRRIPVAVKPYLFSDSPEMLEILGMAARLEIGKLQEGMPAAKAGLKVGDIIVEYAGIEYPSRTQIHQANEKLRGTQTYIRVLRDGKIVETPLRPTRRELRNVIGAMLLPVQNETVVARVAEDSAADKAGIVPRAVITKVNDTPVKTWPEVFIALKSALGKEVTLTYRLDGQTKTARIGLLTEKLFDPGRFSVVLPAIHLAEGEPLRTDVIRVDPLRAVWWGVKDTWDWIVRTWKGLVRLLQGRVSPKGAAGPVGIGFAAVLIARHDPIELMYFMAMLSAIIAVFNFLPLPVLDGGHVVLVLVEKLRGRPLPPKVLVGIYTAGWILILGLLVAVTFQDIMRWVNH